MFTEVYATRFVKAMSNGRTKPCLLECTDSNGNNVELVVKCSEGCFEKEKNLALEAISAFLAADLGLPVPESFLVKLDNEFISIIDNLDTRNHFANSCTYAFGSKYLPSMSVWAREQPIPDFLFAEAIEILVFDAIVVNSDRRPENPNCLFSGSDLAIIDHELTFQKVLFWKEPWAEGGFDDLLGRDRHIFAKPYHTKPILELDRFVRAWQNLSPGRFQEYKNALPREWITDERFVNEIIEYLDTVKNNITHIVDNALRAFR